MDPASYRISEKTVEHIGEVAVLSVPGVRSVDAKLAGLAGRSFPRVNAQIDRPAGSVILDVEIVSSYPAPVGAISDEVRETIGSHVETLTGLTVQKVNIVVVDAESASLGQRVTRNDLLHHPTGIAPVAIRVQRSKVSSPHVQAPVKLADINVDDSTYTALRHVHTPDPVQIRHVETPPPLRPASVDTPEPLRITPVDTPEPVRPVSPEMPGMAPLKAVGIEKPTRPRHISVPAPAPLKKIEVTRVAPRIPAERPAPRPPRLVEIKRRPQTAPVSLPAQRPLAEITVERGRYVDVVRPMPEPLRAITVPRLDVVSPHLPPQRPLAEITIEPDRADDDALAKPIGDSTQTVRIRPDDNKEVQRP